MTSVRPFLVGAVGRESFTGMDSGENRKMRLKPVIAGNPFKECSSKKEWRNGELIGGRSGASWFFFYDNVLIC